MLSILCNAYRTNRIQDLVESSNGIAIVESREQFGGGNIQHYNTIKSNTYGYMFLEIIRYGRLSKEDKKQLKNSSKYMMPFAEFAETSEIVKAMEKLTHGSVPLGLVGVFMSFVGNVMLNDIHSRFNKKIFYGRSTAKKITQMVDGFWMVEVE